VALEQPQLLQQLPTSPASPPAGACERARAPHLLVRVVGAQHLGAGGHGLQHVRAAPADGALLLALHAPDVLLQRGYVVLKGAAQVLGQAPAQPRHLLQALHGHVGRRPAGQQVLHQLQVLQVQLVQARHVQMQLLWAHSAKVAGGVVLVLEQPLQLVIELLEQLPRPAPGQQAVRHADPAVLALLEVRVALREE
jgi:hypothetical protein